MYLRNLFIKKIQVKVTLFKGLNSFQIVILQEKHIFVIFYDLFLKMTVRSDWPTNDGR